MTFCKLALYLTFVKNEVVLPSATIESISIILFPLTPSVSILTLAFIIGAVDNVIVSSLKLIV